MILFMTMAIKIFIFAGILLIGCRLFGKRIAKKYLLYLGVLLIFFALSANYFSACLPSLTDTITLNALGENREDAKGMEIYLESYTIDGKTFSAGSFLEIESGRWFWSGETYMWRPETDIRQPEGITRTIALNVPVGWERTLNFTGCVSSGFVQIDNGNDVWIEDTYTEDNSEKNVYIGRSKTLLLIINQVRYLVLYTVILLALSLSTIFITKRVLQTPKEAKEWLDKNIGKFLYMSIAFATFLIMFHYADRISFWIDELAQINFTKDTLKDSLLYSLSMADANPPFELLFHTVWYHISPYGEKWLLLPAIFVCCCSVFFVGLIGEKLKSKYCGCIAAILLAFSTTFWSDAAYEYRAYGFFVFFSVLSLYFYIKRNEDLYNKIYGVLFSLLLLFNAMTHYFAMINMAGFFFADLYLLFNGKIQYKKVVSSYFLPGFASVCWLLAVYIACGGEIPNSASGTPVPTFLHIYDILQYLAGKIDILYYFMLLGISLALIYFLSFFKEKKFIWQKFYIVFILLMFVCVITLLYLYGNFVNQNSTMWRARYFLFLIPNAYLLIAWVIDSLIEVGLDNSNMLQKGVVLFFAILLSVNCIVTMSSAKSSEPYKEAADWIYTQSDYIFNDQTLIITTIGNHATNAWREYYITRQGRRDALNVVLQSHIKNYNDILQYGRIYLQYIHKAPASSLQAVLNEYYVLETDNKDVKVRVYARK